MRYWLGRGNLGLFSDFVSLLRAALKQQNPQSLLTAATGPDPLENKDVGKLFAKSPAREHLALIVELLKDSAKSPTAIIQYGAETNAVLWAAKQLGLSVPQDHSIINMDPQAGEWTGVPLTSYLVPEY